jgi:hypothetical protein
MCDVLGRGVVVVSEKLFLTGEENLPDAKISGRSVEAVQQNSAVQKQQSASRDGDEDIFMACGIYQTRAV